MRWAGYQLRVRRGQVKDETYNAISMLLSADPTVHAEKRREVLSACRRVQRKHRRLITIRQAAEMLDCHPKTVERYAGRGLLTQVRFSPRKIRYDRDEVEAFASEGLGGRREDDE